MHCLHAVQARSLKLKRTCLPTAFTGNAQQLGHGLMNALQMRMLLH